VLGEGGVFLLCTVTTALERIVSRSRGGHVLETDLAAVSTRAIEAEALLRNALPAAGMAPFGTPPGGLAYNPANDPLLRYTNPLTGREEIRPQSTAFAAMSESEFAAFFALAQMRFTQKMGFDPWAHEGVA
jgi:hypothetical protein